MTATANDPSDDGLIRIDPSDADPGFSAFENLIICDLVNNNKYLDALLAHQVDGTPSGNVMSNAPSNTTLPKPATGIKALPDRRTRIQDVLDWHYTRPWRDGASNQSSEELFKGADEPDSSGPPPYTLKKLPKDDVEPETVDIAYFLQALSKDASEADPHVELRQRQREMLAITADRFAGALSIGTGRRIVQSLSMFVDFTVRKDKNRNVLMW